MSLAHLLVLDVLVVDLVVTIEVRNIQVVIQHMGATLLVLVNVVVQVILRSAYQVDLYWAVGAVALSWTLGERCWMFRS